MNDQLQLKEVECSTDRLLRRYRAFQATDTPRRVDLRSNVRLSRACMVPDFTVGSPGFRHRLYLMDHWGIGGNEDSSQRRSLSWQIIFTIVLFLNSRAQPTVPMEELLCSSPLQVSVLVLQFSQWIAHYANESFRTHYALVF